MGVSGLSAQTGYYREFIFQNITVNDGLAHRTAHSIVQDHQGYIWIGTNNGLNRYDGHQMKTYRWDLSDSVSLPGNIITKLFVDSRGELWVLTSPGKLCRYMAARDQFNPIQSVDKKTSFQSVTEDHNGKIWILDNQNTLFNIDSTGISLSSRSYKLSIPFQAHQPYIREVYIDRKNRIWAATVNEGIHLFTIENEKIQYTKRLYSSNGLSRIHYNPIPKKLWLSVDSQILYAEPEEDEVNLKLLLDIRTSFPGIRGEIRDICADKKGHIWVSIFGSGLLQLRQLKGELISRHFSGETRREKGLSNPHIEDMFLDRYNVLWIGTQAGVFCLHVNQKPFYQINKILGKEESLIHNIVHAIWRDKFLWIGTIQGLTVIDTDKERFYNYRVLSDSDSVTKPYIISSILKDSRGSYWIGTDHRGLFKVDQQHIPEQLALQKIASPAFLSFDLTHTDIRALTEDEYGRIWIGTSDKGIFLLNYSASNKAYPDKLERVSAVKVGRITNLYKDPHENIIWAGSWNHGLIRIGIHSEADYDVTYYQHEPEKPGSLSLNHVNPILKTDRHTLWVGTIGGGLNKMTFHSGNRVEFRHFGTKDGLPDNTIHTILDDEDGNIWLGGDGLTRFNPSSEQSTHFDSHDGLQGNLFIVNAAFRDKQGFLYFGGPYGLNFFDPQLINKEESYPDLIIEGLSIMNKKVEVGRELNGRILLKDLPNQVTEMTILEKENDLTIDFLVMHTASPQDNRLKYRLKGYQEDWVDAAKSQTTVTYSNLKPGTYELQLVGCNGDGIWTPEAKRLTIEILPYWYKSKWAFVGYVILFFVLLILFRRTILIQSNLKNNLRIAEIEMQKDQEVVEMKTRFFNNITHELRNPLTLIHGPIEELLNEQILDKDTRRNYYYLIRQNTLKLLNLVNRLLDFRKAETEYFALKLSAQDFIPFAKEVFLSFRFLAKEQEINYHFHANVETLPLYFDQEKMEVVLCNLLSNAFNYSNRGDDINLSVELQKTHCMIKVSDSGKGMPPEEVNHIFDRFYQIVRAESSNIMGTGIGLAMVKEIIQLHEGTIEVNTQPGKGSTFTIHLPLGRKHVREDYIIQRSEEPKTISPFFLDHGPDDTDVEKEETDHPLKKMLIMDDNSEIREFIRSVFHKHFIIKEATNGIEGLQSLKNHLPDIIISDIMMDQMDGITFCQELRQHKNYLHIPIILLTARTAQVYKVGGLDSGADAYLTKPFQARVLRAQVNNLLKSRAALKAYYRNQITLAPLGEQPPPREAAFMDQLIGVIEIKMEEQEITAESLAEAMAVSHSTLYRRVKTYTGESINSLIRSVRLKRAAALLLDSNLNISEVAWQVGFADVNYFGKCFRKQFHMNPSTYIKIHQNNPETP